MWKIFRQRFDYFDSSSRIEHIFEQIKFNFFLQIRNVGMSIVGFAAYLILFAFLKVFPLTLDLFDLHGCMIIFAILSVVGIIFVATVLEETNGQSLDDIGCDEQIKCEHDRARSISFG